MAPHAAAPSACESGNEAKTGGGGHRPEKPGLAGKKHGKEPCQPRHRGAQDVAEEGKAEDEDVTAAGKS
eukprot:12902560-Prorocentrum_lima.AAC.1